MGKNSIKNPIVDQYYPVLKDKLIFFVNNIIHNLEDSEDIVQECFVKLYNYSMKKDLTNENIKALLYKIAKNSSLNYIKKYNKKEVIPIELNENSVHFLLKDENFLMTDFGLKVIKLLKDDEVCKSIFKLKFIENLNNYEIAIKINVSERTIRRKLNKIISLIKLNFSISDFID